MTSKISIVFTSYNHKDFLKEALDSLLRQTFADFELLIIDDCSTDGSQEVLRKYEAQDERIRLFVNHKNSGSYVYSTNQGASYATAPYVVFAQCDDYAEPTQLQQLYDAITSNQEVGVVFSASKMVDKRGDVLNEDYNVREKAFKKLCAVDVRISKKQMERFLLDSCVIPNLSAAMIRRDLFEKQGGLSDRYFVLADWDFWLKTSQECDFYYLREPLNNFRQHDTTIRASVKLKRQIEEVFLMYFGFFHSSGMEILPSLRWKNRVARIWICYAKQGPFVWLTSLCSLMRTSAKYDPIFPIVMIFNLLVAPFLYVGRRISIAKK